MELNTLTGKTRFLFEEASSTGINFTWVDNSSGAVGVDKGYRLKPRTIGLHVSY